MPTLLITQQINSGLQRFTISNIPNGSDRLYLHLLAEVFFTLMIYAMLYFWYRKVKQFDGLLP